MPKNLYTCWNCSARVYEWFPSSGSFDIASMRKCSHCNTLYGAPPPEKPTFEDHSPAAIEYHSYDSEADNDDNSGKSSEEYLTASDEWADIDWNENE